ncbi:hypothetical protein HL658_29015 [Azospirillum sp. RWY-5-1]|uniref:Uncharacterized protein n=1 Tax=Azospirillum oleiclasticum TaxID=2735135 RepID=A0ABX2TIB9_9PROT|nr:hypothetical protein [Azospirillum oleiclasticum]NYZ16605.1 hypothetical protein [Azospirillum oleiclasticum]NYZ24092.1 hypothetical protein [Azospirillum oleiclasticum]
MVSYDGTGGPAGVVKSLIENAAKSLDEMSETAGEIAPDVGEHTDILVSAQRIADKAAIDLRRLTAKLGKAG